MLECCIRFIMVYKFSQKVDMTDGKGWVVLLYRTTSSDYLSLITPCIKQLQYFKSSSFLKFKPISLTSERYII